MRACEDRMIIRTIEDFRTAQVYPDLFFETLTDRTVAVTTGVVVEGITAAGFADFKIEAAVDYPATADIIDGVPLLIR